MKTIKVTYGRTIVLEAPPGKGSLFKAEKAFFSWEGELEEGDSSDDVLAAMREVADDFEREEREKHIQRTHERLYGRRKPLDSGESYYMNGSDDDGD